MSIFLATVNNSKNPKLKELIEKFGTIIGKTQEDDGYINTYNQIHFPGKRWINLQLEHELYCFGHLIEAAISWYYAFEENEKKRSLLVDVAIQAADLIYEFFYQQDPHLTPGHQEIELALFKFGKLTGNTKYCALAEDFIQRRGNIKRFFFHFLKNTFSTGNRLRKVSSQRKKFNKSHPDKEDKNFSLPGHVKVKSNFKTFRRFVKNIISGSEFQQHKPVEVQTTPEGHSVRFGYQETAAAMICREKENSELLNALEDSWKKMVMKRMYISGGIGQFPIMEGFGHDFELDPEIAYCETCAALASMFWSWEMFKLTKKAQYADLFELQLYNASLVSMSNDGKKYFYRNPLACKKHYLRQEWYAVPCCPSNISRTLASLGKYIYSVDKVGLWIHQYVGNKSLINQNNHKIEVDMTSNFPWNGTIELKIKLLEIKSNQINRGNEKNPLFSLFLRKPSWCSNSIISLSINEKTIENLTYLSNIDSENRESNSTAVGYNPLDAQYIKIDVKSEDFIQDFLKINLRFPMKVKIHKIDPNVISGKFSISRGPIIYALESLDNPDIDIFKDKIDVNSFQEDFTSIESNNLDSKIVLLKGLTKKGKPFKAIPYFFWGNRGGSKMNTYFND